MSGEGVEITAARTVDGEWLSGDMTCMRQMGP